MFFKVINLRRNPVRESMPGFGVFDIPGKDNEAGLDNFVIVEDRQVAYALVDGLNNTCASGKVLSVEEFVGDSEVVEVLTGNPFAEPEEVTDKPTELPEFPEDTKG